MRGKFIVIKVGRVQETRVALVSVSCAVILAALVLACEAFVFISQHLVVPRRYDQRMER